LRAQRGNLVFLKPTNRQKRDCLVGFFSCHCERSAAISTFPKTTNRQKRDCFVPRNDKFILSLRTQPGNLAFPKDYKQTKVRLLRRFLLLSLRAQRGNLAFLKPTNRQKRDCFVPRNDKLILSLRTQRGNLDCILLPREDFLSLRAQRGNLAFRKDYKQRREIAS